MPRRLLPLGLALVACSLSGRDAASVPARDPGPPVDRLSAIVPALRACWQPPAGLARLERIDVTARLALRMDGSLVGEPLVTFVTGTLDARGRELLTRSVGEAIRACTPLRMSSGLSRAIAGRPMSIRFIYIGRKGQGV